MIGTAMAGSSILGANDAIRTGIIGAGGRGRLLTGEFKEVGAQMTAVCDVYETNLQAGLKVANTGAKPYNNYKRLLDDKDIDAVIIATPDHWHAQMAIDAVNAGKDVYVEKPMAHLVDEGFRMIDAVRRTKRVLQVGTQRRSYDVYLEGKKVFDTSNIGDVRLVNSWWYNHQASLGARELEGKLDWEQWQGPTKKREFDLKRFRGWYYFWDYSGGLMVGQAAHAVDSIQWFMKSTYPTAVTATGGKVNLEGAEVPETTCMCMEYPENYMSVFTVGYKAMRYHTFADQMNQYNGSNARFDIGRESYALYPQQPTAHDLKPSVEFRKPNAFNAATRAHIRNFLECVKSRKDPNAPVEAGNAASVTLCMAIESLRTGRRVKFNTVTRKMEG